MLSCLDINRLFFEIVLFSLIDIYLETKTINLIIEQKIYIETMVAQKLELGCNFFNIKGEVKRFALKTEYYLQVIKFIFLQVIKSDRKGFRLINFLMTWFLYHLPIGYCKTFLMLNLGKILCINKNKFINKISLL